MALAGLDVPICGMCREPITNFVCQEHLARDISRWLPEGEVRAFAQFHARLSAAFRSPFLANFREPSGETCTCKSHDPILCIFCYSGEVNSWLAGRSTALAGQFRGIFSFGFHRAFRGQHALVADQAGPPQEFGVCDSCGEYSDNLELTDAQWVCNACVSE